MTTIRAIGAASALAVLGLGVAGCGPPKVVSAEKPASPATVAKPAKEDDLATVVLTPEAETRLGVTIAVAEVKPVARSRSYAGDVIVPPGRMITVASPFAATVVAAGDAIAPGMPLKKDQPVVALLPLLSAEAKAKLATLRIEAEGQVDSARKQLDVAKVALDRVEDLRKNRVAVGSATVEDAKAQYGIAETALKNAQDRRDILAKTIQEAGAGSLTPLPLTSPEDGILSSLSAAPGQQVGPGAVLFAVEKLDPVWVRVPIYVGDLKSVDPAKEARVGGLSSKPTDTGTSAKPVSAPPSGDPLAATVDLFYEVANPSAALRPGQRLGVSVPLSGSAEGLVIPASAVYYDIGGGTWVYEQIKDHTFVRRRVEIEQVSGGEAILTRGLKIGAKVVTAAVAEIYGTEFGFAK